MLDTPTSHSVIRCGQCGQPSYLRIIVPRGDKPRHEERLFECKSCGNAETLFVKIDE